MMVADHLQMNPTSGQLFLFRSRSVNKIKMLWWDRNGFWMFYKRLEKGKFQFPIKNDAALELTRDQFNWLLSGLNCMEHKLLPSVTACPKGCDGSIITAPAPLQILPKIKATEELLSFLVVSKLDDRQPLYHLEKQLRERYGVDCSRQSMANWMIALMAPLQPIFNLMKDEVIDYDVTSIDATTLQVLNEPGRKAETKSYLYCIRGGTPEKSVVLYEYNHKEHKQFVRDWLEGFKGYLHADADNFFEDYEKLLPWNIKLDYDKNN